MHTGTVLSAMTAAAGLFGQVLSKPAPELPRGADPHITPAPALASAALAARQFTLPFTDPSNASDDDEEDDDDATDTGHHTHTYPRLSPSRISKSLSCQSKYFSLVADQPDPLTDLSTLPASERRALASWLASAARSVAAKVTAAAGHNLDVSLTTLCDDYYPGSGTPTAAATSTPTITPPAVLQSAYSEYMRSSSAWASSAAPEVHSLASACGGRLSALAEWLVVTDAEGCTSAVVGLVQAWKGGRENGTATTSSSDGSTGSESGSGTATTATGASGTAGTAASGQGGDGGGTVSTSSSSTGGAAAPRETGFVAAAAAAVVGVVGVVAAL